MSAGQSRGAAWGQVSPEYVGQEAGNGFYACVREVRFLQVLERVGSLKNEKETLAELLVFYSQSTGLLKVEN